MSFKKEVEDASVRIALTRLYNMIFRGIEMENRLAEMEEENALLKKQLAAATSKGGKK